LDVKGRKTGRGENCIMMNFMAYILHLILFFFSTGFYSPYRTLAFLNGFLDPQTFGMTPWLGDQSNTKGLYRNTGQHNTETRRHTSMPRAVFEPAISMFKLS
jgi:hypothetical protein